jgi:alkanesulfonate monooxygenase SsuD/methylene tetrahydromethanopterin reductase-like flavin-dependent oxidoreductase (luciferase family)
MTARRADEPMSMRSSAQPLQFGTSIVPYADSLERIRELVRVADEGGLALVGIQDHPFQHHFFDTWSLISTLLAETRHISFFTDVANLSAWWVARPTAGCPRSGC